MSGHVTVETLWRHARGELEAAPRAELLAHLRDCGACQGLLAQVQQAVTMVGARPEPPPLSADAARRVRLALEAEASRPSFVQRLFGARWWVPVAVAAAALVAVVVWRTPTEPELVAHVVDVGGGRGLEVREGAALATELEAPPVVALPDGATAHAGQGAKVKLATLRRTQVVFELGGGSLRLEAPHRPERTLVVKAGELEVVDVGTVFEVRRAATSIVVAVTEGAVDVRTPRGVVRVEGRETYTWADGQGSLAAEPQPAKAEVQVAAVPPPPPVVTPPPPPPVEVTAAPRPKPSRPEPAPAAVMPTPSEPPPTTVTPPPVGPPSSPEEEWAQLPGAVAGSGKPPPPVPQPTTPPPPGSATPAPGPMPAGGEGALDSLGRKFREVTGGVASPITPSGVGAREQRSRDVRRFADGGAYGECVRAAVTWLGEPVSAHADEPKWRRSVMLDQARCLTKLGREQEAAEVRSRVTP